MQENNIFHERYCLERLLGRGNFSEVWLAKDIKTDILVALKIYAPATGLDDNGINVLSREFALVVNANHKNLLKPLYYDCHERKPYLVLPYCEAGSIMKDIGQMNEQDAWRLLRDTASGLAFLHAMNPPIIHQDIKPDNIMTGQTGDYMITDFGVSTRVRSTLRRSMSQAFASAGTIAYMAPERFGKDNTPIMANDIYSLGATVYEMLAGDTPFGDDGGLMQKRGAEIPQLNGEYSEQLKRVITRCLAEDPWKRPTAAQLESYADAVCRGLKPRFDDEPMPKRKLLWCVAASVAVLAIAGACFLVVGRNSGQGIAADSMQVETDSMAQAITESSESEDVAGGMQGPLAPEGDIQERAAAQPQATGESEASGTRQNMKVPADNGHNASNRQEPGLAVQLSISESELDFKSKGGTQIVHVECSKSDWYVASVPQWIKTNISGSTLSITCEANQTKEERSCTLTVKCGDRSRNIAIYQKKSTVFRRAFNRITNKDSGS